MFPEQSRRYYLRFSLPHAGGGVSSQMPQTLQGGLSSPRRWGCFRKYFEKHNLHFVFPTQVGVFLRRCERKRNYVSLPHAGGGVSPRWTNSKLLSRSSPRRWGCFCGFTAASGSTYVFPTQVGVFLKFNIQKLKSASLPHAGGGVSHNGCCISILTRSSPRRWGCFYMRVPLGGGNSVFPTQVGVFLPQCGLAHCQLGLPHAGGGVSDSQVSAAVIRLSSPRRWGCFLNSMGYAVLSIVFPTQVGVFLKSLRCFVAVVSLPHAGGGVSTLCIL